MVTLAQLRKEAKAVGCEIECDADCQCYRAIAPPGFRWEPDLHEIIGVYGGGVIGNGWTRAEARADLYERIHDYGHVEKCDNPDCDYCCGELTPGAV